MAHRPAQPRHSSADGTALALRAKYRGRALTDGSTHDNTPHSEDSHNETRQVFTNPAQCAAQRNIDFTRNSAGLWAGVPLHELRAEHTTGQETSNFADNVHTPTRPQNAQKSSEARGNNVSRETTAAPIEFGSKNTDRRNIPNDTLRSASLQRANTIPTPDRNTRALAGLAPQSQALKQSSTPELKPSDVPAKTAIKRNTEHAHKRAPFRAQSLYRCTCAVAAVTALCAVVIHSAAPSVALQNSLNGKESRVASSSHINNHRTDSLTEKNGTSSRQESPSHNAGKAETGSETPPHTDDDIKKAAGSGLDFTTPTSLTVLVNKTHPLPENFAPAALVPVQNYGIPMHGTQNLLVDKAAEALGRMHSDSKAAGSEFGVSSAYRSIDVQRWLYQGYVQKSSVEQADTYSARPRYSEHQTGLAVDVFDVVKGCDIQQCFQDTSSGTWLAEHSWEYGFILRYPKDYTHVTGYMYEPWHFRYIGVEEARKYHESGATTYEEFLGQLASPSY